MRYTCRSYTLLCIAPVAGPQCPEAQGIVDDLCSMLINRRHDFAAAEKYARSNYQSLTDKKLGGYSRVSYGAYGDRSVDAVWIDRQTGKHTVRHD